MDHRRRHLAALRCVAVAWLALGPRVAAQPGGAGDASEQSKRLVVMIDGRFDAGSPTFGAGIVVGTAGDKIYVATANHVVRRGRAEATNLTARFSTSPAQPMPATLAPQHDAALDVAVLVVADPGRRVTAAGAPPFRRVRETGGMTAGAELKTLGYPGRRPWRSYFAPHRLVSLDATHLRFEAPLLASGDSGGGLFTDRWELVGMVVSDEAPDGAAVRIERIIERLRGWGYPVALVPSPPAAVASEFQRLRTPNLGIHFVQDGKPVPMTPAKIAGAPADVWSVTLAPRPFELRIPESNWKNPRDEYPALQVAVADTPRLFSLLKVGQNREATPYFAMGTGMATTKHGPAELLTAGTDDDAHNYIVGERFDLSGKDYRGFFVSAITRRYAKENFLASGRTVYLVFYMNTEPDKGAGPNPGSDRDTLTQFELELVVMKFSER